jgi:SNF2 family DNA or RNA helicase
VCEAQGLRCSRLDGSTPADTRMDLVRSFNEGLGKVCRCVGVCELGFGGNTNASA